MDKYAENISYNHGISINERKLVYITGVNKIESFDEEEFLLDTNMGYLVIKGNGLEIVAEEKDNVSTPYGFAVLKGQNADLLKMFNEGLKNIKANGTYDEIVAKYTSAK